MHYEIIWWVLSIGVAWLILTMFIPLDTWLGALFGRASKWQALEDRVAELERRMNSMPGGSRGG